MLRKTVLVRALSIAFSTAALTAAVVPAALAQSNAAGNIYGNVEAAAGSTVVLLNTDTGLKRTIVPDSTGRYFATALPPGHYKVELVRDGQVSKTVEVDDPKLVSKALSLEGFERVDAVEATPPKALDPAPDDYPADPVQAAPFEDLKIPTVGAGTIPENWREMHHSSRMKLARQLSGMDDISNDAAAIAVIEALLEAK